VNGARFRQVLTLAAALGCGAALLGSGERVGPLPTDAVSLLRSVTAPDGPLVVLAGFRLLGLALAVHLACCSTLALLGGRSAVARFAGRASLGLLGGTMIAAVDPSIGLAEERPVAILRLVDPRTSIGLATVPVEQVAVAGPESIDTGLESIVVDDPTPRSSGAGRHVVVEGESFWSIAADHADGRPVATYWRTLIEANRSRLVDPTNPDLIHPGLVLDLPAPPEPR